MRWRQRDRHMEIWGNILLGVVGIGAGLGVSGGVFTTLIAIGLIPRFAGKTHTADHIFLYEEMVVCGTLFGGLISLFFPFIRVEKWMNQTQLLQSFYPIISIGFLVLFGLFAGIFVGCLALAIAEMLDSIPIFARRMKFRHGIGIVVLGMALGKTIGSLIYFIRQFAE